MTWECVLQAGLFLSLQILSSEKFSVGKCTAVSAFQPVLQGRRPRCRVEGTDSSTCPFVTTEEMSGWRLPYKELPMLLLLAPGILCEISCSNAGAGNYAV
jgi:hypothetical protein